MNKKPRLYIATMYPFDEECRQRIARHREMRKAKEFETLECYTHLDQADVTGYGTVLLECMSNLTANEMYQADGAGEQCVQAITQGMEHLLRQCENLVIVTNEIFSDGIEYDPETERYQKYLGELNQRISRLADLVVEVVYSIPIVHKGSLKEVGR